MNARYHCVLKFTTYVLPLQCQNKQTTKAEVDTEGNKAKRQRRTTCPSAKLAPTKSGPKLIKVSMKY